MGGAKKATMADLLYFYMMNPDKAHQRLMLAGYKAGVNGGDARAKAEQHLEAYGKLFDARAKHGLDSASKIIDQEDRQLTGLTYNFPSYEEGTKGKLRPVQGCGWGGARRGKKYESQRARGHGEQNGPPQAGDAPITGAQPPPSKKASPASHATRTFDDATPPTELSGSTKRAKRARAVPVPRGWSASPSLDDVPENRVCLMKAKHVLTELATLRMCCPDKACTGTMTLIS
ncbi:hypothetical protein CLOP_g18375 [Closterium sp. NIES-67]|nr:hypothetical protein CLOP_g18375 [Closterium sp. NIES-67]